MNKAIKRILIFSIITYVIGGLFKVMHWPYSQLIQLIGLITAILLFTPLLAFSKFKNKPTGRLLYYYISGLLSIEFILIGDLITKIDKDSNFGLVSGLLGAIILIFIYFPITIKLRKISIFPSDKKKYRNRIILVSVYLILLIISTIIPLIMINRQNRLLEEKFRLELEKEKLENYIDSIDINNDDNK